MPCPYGVEFTELFNFFLRARLRRGPEIFAALLAGTDFPQMLEGVDAGGVPVGKKNLYGVISDGVGALGRDAGFEHGQHGCSRLAAHAQIFFALVVAQRAGTQVAQIGERIFAGVPVGPGDFNAVTRGDANLYVDWFFSLVNWYGHGVLGLMVSATATILADAAHRLLTRGAAASGRDGIAVRARLGVPQKSANALVQLRTDDVLELACVRIGLGVGD